MPVNIYSKVLAVDLFKLWDYHCFCFLLLVYLHFISFYVFLNKLKENEFFCNEENNGLFLKDALKKKRCY